MRLHNVPDDEKAVGADGKKLPFAIVSLKPNEEYTPSKLRETGSFGRSTRRSTTRTQTPARREDPAILAADDLFSTFIKDAKIKETAPKPVVTSPSTAIAIQEDNEPTEVLIYGFGFGHAWKAIATFESIAGPILEDYSRQPEHTRFPKSADTTALIRRTYTAGSPASRKVNNVVAGNHFVKVTFNSHLAAVRAVRESPHTIYGHLVFAELYRGQNISAIDDLPIPVEVEEEPASPPTNSPPTQRGFGLSSPTPSIPTAENTPESRIAYPSLSSGWAGAPKQIQQPNSTSSTTSTLSSGTVTEAPATTNLSTTIPNTTINTGTSTSSQPAPSNTNGNNNFCRRIPTARRAVLQPADQILLKQPGWFERTVGSFTWLKWLDGGLLEQDPLTEEGQFDWERANWYWKFFAYIDWWLGTNTLGLKDE